MIKDLVNITLEEIKESSANSIKSDNSVVMYLQNTGSKEHKWSSTDINVWIHEDIDD